MDDSQPSGRASRTSACFVEMIPASKAIIASHVPWLLPTRGVLIWERAADGPEGSAPHRNQPAVCGGRCCPDREARVTCVDVGSGSFIQWIHFYLSACVNDSEKWPFSSKPISTQNRAALWGNILLGSKLNQGTSQITTFYIGKGLRINFTFETFMALL